MMNSLDTLLSAVEKARRQGITGNFLNIELLFNGSHSKNEFAHSFSFERFSSTVLDSNSITWDFTSSLLFVTSIVTTIGYGNLAPATNIGKLLCIFYGVIGIPATVLILLSIVKLLLKGPVNLLESWIVWNIYTLHRCTSLLVIKILHLTFVALIILIIVFLIPALAFWNLEKEWSFLDSFYYCFITVTTIGLGDFVPGQQNLMKTTAYRVSIMVFMFYGVLMVMLLIVVVKRIPIFNFEKILKIEEVKEDSKTIERIRVITRSSCEYTPITTGSDKKYYGTSYNKSNENNNSKNYTIIP
ncbi:potassium channel subfamily K member 1-like protein [Dinothrombium tinctorium]|uniref:Potassium channel subfamily K member 1-like protein n=1 Tax=Dinothrombium tinctorium TaxID=1965070 RepID=A0A3S3PPI6_9ACAR|nr:potassium channel subfamily K member 1-like protein [Dinothrombium tinctorium]